MLKATDFFSLDDFAHKAIFSDTEFVWEALSKIKSYLTERLVPNMIHLRREGNIFIGNRVLYNDKLFHSGFDIFAGDVTKGKLKVVKDGVELKGASVIYEGAMIFDDEVYIGKGSVIEPGALIYGPTIIGNHTEIRQGAYIRGNCIIGDGCVVGHTTEMKNSIMLNHAKAGHFAYIGDSILGNNINLGAGVKLANLKFSGSEIILKIDNQSYLTGIRKFGAILGDNVQIGCNAVTNPGSLIGADSYALPLISVQSGYYPRYSIIGKDANKELR
jgi:NDP-sugar pyrophosphorylase family protein